MTAEIWEYINKSSQILGIIAFLPMLYATSKLLLIGRRKKQELKKIRDKPGDMPGILIIDVIRDGSDNSIQAQVENWLWQQPSFVEKKENSIIKPIIFNGDLSSNDMADISQKVRKSVGELQALGVTNYHIFIRGPLALGCVVGCVLANHRPSIIYQKSLTDGDYNCWGAINQ